MEENVITLHGKFTRNTIILDDGREFKCITYGSVRKQIDEKYGFFNLRYSEDINDWIIFQYILDEQYEASQI